MAQDGVARTGTDGGAAQVNQRPQDRPKSTSMRPLKALWPFLRPHKMLIGGAIAALLAAAGFTLVLPLALRRMIDLGFDAANAAFIDQYFLAMLLVAAALATATALRYYLVTRLGERVIADLRRAVYDHVIAMSPAFFETMKTGETLSRLTTDTTVIQGVVGSTASIALRNVLVLFGGLILLFITSPWLSAVVMLVVPAIVVPIIVLGRKGPGALAGVARQDRRKLWRRRRDPSGRPDGAGFHLRGLGPAPFRRRHGRRL